MAQLGVVYLLRVRPKGDTQAPWRLLGDIDNAGTSLIDVLPQGLANVSYYLAVSGYDDPQPSVTFDRMIPVQRPDCVGAVMRHHEYGARGLLNRLVQRDSYPFTEVDDRQVEIGMVVSAPPLATSGFVAFQVANGRSIKTGVSRELHGWLGDCFDLYLHIEPTAPTEAVQAAIEEQGVGTVAFRKLRNPSGLFANAGEWWRDGDDVALVEHRIKPARNRRLLGQKLVRFIRSGSDASESGEQTINFPDLATFDGREYDELAVEITIHGRTKQLIVRPEGPAMPNAFSWELNLGPGFDEGALGRALSELIPPAPGAS